MTLNQMYYVVTIAGSKSMTEAAGKLFLSQPSLTASIHELEKELNIKIFNRTNKGITLTSEGEEFLSYARQMLESQDLIRERYLGVQKGKKKFCVSSQHYSFAVEAFVDLLKNEDFDEYEFHMRETQTYEIIEDVALLRSDIGVLYLNPFNRETLMREINVHDLEFTPLFEVKPHVFISDKNPLSNKNKVTLDDLAPYPRLSYEQGEHNAFFFFEEIQSTLDRKKDVVVTDRATLFNLIIGLNGYTICSGVINTDLNGKNIVARPLEVDDYMEIGYVIHKHVKQRELTKKYIDALKQKK